MLFPISVSVTDPLGAPTLAETVTPIDTLAPNVDGLGATVAVVLDVTSATSSVAVPTELE